MKIREKLIIIFVIILIFNLDACSKANDNNTNNQTTEGNNKNTSSDKNKYTAQGRIVKIDAQGIHIQNKDKVDVYKVGKDVSDKYYVGEFVGINALSGGAYDVLSDSSYDYNTRYTTEGNPIKRVTGTVSDVKDNFVTAITEMGNVKFVNTGNFNLKSGSQAMFDYVEMNGGNQLVSFYDDASKINVKVKKISRGTNGEMKINATAADNKEYEINVKQDAATNFALSTLKVGDDITVYPNTITGNIPAVVDAKLLVKNNK